MSVADTYETDFHAWTLHNAELLRQGRLTEIDVDHIAEELEEMGGNRERELEHRLGVLTAHLLKWRYQPSQRSSSWSGTIKEQRRKLARLLRKNPSLKPLLIDACNDTYGDALAMVERDTGLDERYFPETCPFTLEQILDSEFWPE
jgi:ribosomal protein L29